MRQYVLVSLIAQSICASAQAAEVQLLLMRDTKADKSCDVPVTHGVLYGVPVSTPLESVVVPLGLKVIAYTEELPPEDNAQNASSIPADIYPAHVVTKQSKPWMKDHPERAWRLELEGVANRTAIQVHYGKDRNWSTGCIILTKAESKPLVCSESDSPQGAISSLRQYVESASQSGKEPSIAIKIVDQP